jgi:hypothetical protein
MSASRFADLRALDRDLLARVDSLMAWLGVSGKRTGNRWTGGDKGARIEVVLTGSNAGAWGAWSAGHKGRGLIGVIAHVRGIPYREAIPEARAFLGHAPRPDKPKPGLAPKNDAERRAPRIAKVHKLWAESRPVADTLGEVYLVSVRKFPRPADGWAADIRFHEQSRALILAGRDASGEVQFVHRVFLTNTGDNVRDIRGKKKKLTFGPMDGAALRLPGDPLGPVQHGEGGETSIAAWLATGFETHCRFGAVGDAARPVQGRRNIALADDDPPGYPTEEALRRALRRWRAAGLDVLVAYPWPERRHDKSDFADVLASTGAEAVRQRVDAATETVPKPEFPDVDFDPGPPPTDRWPTFSGIPDGDTPPPDLPEPRRPNTTMAAHRAKMDAGIDAWIAGEGPPHILNAFAPGTRKNRYTITRLAALAKERRAARRRFLANWRLQHPGEGYEAANDAADDAGHRRLRVACLGIDHGILKQHEELALSLGMFTAHDAGYERTIDPTDPASPPRCTQERRRKATQSAGESMRLVACGIENPDRPVNVFCPDKHGCRQWQSFNACMHAEFVAMPVERLTSCFIGRELYQHGWDFVLIDEPDRVFRPEAVLKIDYLDDHLFDRAPCHDRHLHIDEAATAEARTVVYPIMRNTIQAMANDYWDRELADKCGCTSELADRFVELSNMRDQPTGMDVATNDDDRDAIARISFRRQARALCGFGRMVAAIQRGEEGGGKMELAGEAPRIALYHPRATVNSAFLDARIMVSGAGLDLADVREWLPDAELIEGSADIPEAPHQSLVHVHVGMGAGATENPQRQRFMQAFVKLEGEGLPGVIALQDREELFANIPGLILGHHGAIVGRNDWLKCTTFFNFGSRFLPPPDAARAGAADTGECVPVKRPVRIWKNLPLRGGANIPLQTFEYEHPAAAAANRRAADFDIFQGPLARPRACDRTAETHVTTFDLSTRLLDGCEWDVVITGWKDYAPERMAIAWAEHGYIVRSSFCRHKLFPDIYTKPWTGQNDRRLETDGFEPTMLRLISPPWRDGPREPCVLGRFWRSGHAYRTEGDEFIATMRAFPTFKAEAETKLGARVVIERTLWPERPITEMELSIIQKIEDTTGVIDSWGSQQPPEPPGLARGGFPTGPPPDG